VRSTGRNQHGDAVLEFIRWVMVRKANPDAEAPEAFLPNPAPEVEISRIGGALPLLAMDAYDDMLAGNAARFDDYAIGERIDHSDGMTIEETEHQLAARLYQNNAKVHFNHHSEAQGRFGRRLVYGGHIISLARALSFNGLENAFHIAAINGGRHVAPAFAGDTIYAWSEVLDKAPLANCEGLGALRLRTIALKDRSAEGFPLKDGKNYDPAVLLDLDYWAVLPR
jgi:2-methylfumaryl-CoA hydratase